MRRVVRVIAAQLDLGTGANGLEVEDLIELRPSGRATSTYGFFAPRDWARRFPGENIWKLRKTSAAPT